MKLRIINTKADLENLTENEILELQEIRIDSKVKLSDELLDKLIKVIQDASNLSKISLSRVNITGGGAPVENRAVNNEKLTDLLLIMEAKNSIKEIDLQGVNMSSSEHGSLIRKLADKDIKLNLLDTPIELKKVPTLAELAGKSWVLAKKKTREGSEERKAMEEAENNLTVPVKELLAQWNIYRK